MFRLFAEADASFCVRTVLSPLSGRPLALHKSGPSADVRVHVGARVVQIQREHPGIGTVVPVATANRQAM